MNGWATKPLGELCEISIGKTPSRKSAAFWDTPKRTDNVWLSIADLRPDATGYVHDSKEYLSNSGAALCRPVPPETLLLSFKLTLGRTAFTGRSVFTNEAIAALPVIDNTVLSKEFLRYALAAIDWDKTSEADIKIKGRTLNKAKLQVLPIPVPPLPEQRRIVAILDEAFEGITAAKANEEKNLQSAREVFEAQRECLLSGGEHGWAEKPVGELCEIKHGFAFQSKYFANDGDYICLTPGNFFEDGGYRDRGDKTKYYSGPMPAGFVLSAGQMLVAMTEQAPGLLGSPAIVPVGQQFLHNQRLGLICPKEGTPWVNDFFFHVFNRPAFRKAVHRSATGVKVRHTSPSKLGLIGVSFPASEGDQRKVAAAINAIQQEVDSHQEIIHRKTTALDELKESLLHQAFTGQL
jgi:type I restriction enzyme S subunit